MGLSAITPLGRSAHGLQAQASRSGVSPWHPKTYVIAGGTPLVGTVRVAGAKNAVTKQIVATLLCDEPCVLENVPRTSEVSATLCMLASLGTQSDWLGPHTLELHTPRLAASGIGGEHERLNRIGLLALAPLLHRAGEAWVPLPGGCAIGSRQVDFHLAVLSRMGAQVGIDGQGFWARGRLRGARVALAYPSVGATENALLAAVLAPGRTEILGAAVEPEIRDTIELLGRMGARIEMLPGRRIVVHGVSRLHGARHRVMADRTEAASLAMAAAATHGRVEVIGASPGHLAPFLRVFRAVGGGWHVGRHGLVFVRREGLRPVALATGPYPAFSTDWLPPLVVVLTQAGGVSHVHETVFEDRLAYAERLGAAGARLNVSDQCPPGEPCRFAGQGHFHRCTIHPGPLHGARLTAPDLRGGFAMVLAGLMAEGTSEIRCVERVERGYEQLPEKLLALGADLRVRPEWSTAVA
jgi:UDP-N-acetylglucosamine 1-carboxyvinyltransferase